MTEIKKPQLINSVVEEHKENIKNSITKFSNKYKGKNTYGNSKQSKIKSIIGRKSKTR